MSTASLHIGEPGFRHPTEAQTLEAFIPRAAMQLPVGRLSMAGYPDLGGEVRLGDELEVFLVTWAPNFLRTVSLEAGGRLAFCNKACPHAQFDNMVIQTDPDVRSSISDLSLQQASYAFAAAYRFVEFVSRASTREKFGLEGSHAHLVYNTDPFTKDRENGMGYTKRFHFHFNCWTAEQIGRAAVAPLAAHPSRLQRRRFIDPATCLGARILHDLCERYGLFSGLQLASDLDDSHGNMPAGLRIKLKRGWSELLGGRLLSDLRALHQAAARLYEDIQEVMVGARGAAPLWRRHKLLHAGEIAERMEALEVSEQVRDQLRRMSRVLRNPSERLYGRMQRHRETRVQHLALNGLSYATGFFSPRRNTASEPLVSSEDVWLVIQPKLFSDIGGAGMIYTKSAAAIQIVRNARHFSYQELQARNAFHKDYLECVDIEAWGASSTSLSR